MNQPHLSRLEMKLNTVVHASKPQKERCSEKLLSGDETIPVKSSSRKVLQEEGHAGQIAEKKGMLYILCVCVCRCIISHIPYSGKFLNGGNVRILGKRLQKRGDRKPADLPDHEQ